MAIVKGRWPRAVFYDSKTPLFDWGWSWATAAANIEYEDAAPHTRGWFAIRTTKSHLRIRNFRIYRLDGAERS